MHLTQGASGSTVGKRVETLKMEDSTCRSALLQSQSGRHQGRFDIWTFQPRDPCGFIRDIYFFVRSFSSPEAFRLLTLLAKHPRENISCLKNPSNGQLSSPISCPERLLHALQVLTQLPRPR